VLISPAIMALNGVAITVTLLMLLAAGFGAQVVRRWDIRSGSELQLNLERRTYLISTLVTWCFAAEILSLLLFVYNSEQMSPQFAGAMCATGVLNADPWGWPTLFLKISVFFAGAAWLMLNRVDNQAPDYPLVRVKYGLLLALVPLVLFETVAQLKFFLGLDPDVITSCCGALFTPGGDGVAATVTGLNPALSLSAMYLCGLGLLAAGLTYRRRNSRGAGLSLLAVASFLTAVTAIVSCIAPYAYEHPQHHCPFCILKAGHGFVGYWLYISLFTGTAMALGTGLFSLWRRVPSLTTIIQAEGRRFTLLSLLSFAIFYAVSTYAVLSSNLSMKGVWW